MPFIEASERRISPQYIRLSKVLQELGDPAFSHMPPGGYRGARLEVIPLVNAADLSRASSPRSEGDYEIDWTLTDDFAQRERKSRRVVPANIDRRLITPDNVALMQKRAQELAPLGLSGFRIINVRHKLLNPAPKYNKNLPVELAVSYTYQNASGKKVNIAGSPVISALHRLTEIPVLAQDPDLREEIIVHHLRDYQEALPDHDVSVIAMPPREAASPTHKAFVKLAVPHPLTRAIVQQAFFGDRFVSIYYLAHGKGEKLTENSKKAQELMMDETHRTQILPALDSAWHDNFLACMSTQLPDADRQLAANQISDIAKVLLYDYCDNACPNWVPSDPEIVSRRRLDLIRLRDF